MNQLWIFISLLLGLAASAMAEQEALPSNYVLQPSDVLRVQIYQEPELERELRVSRNHTVTLPLIGSVGLEGKTVDQAEDLIRELYDRDYLVNPQVNLSVLEYSQRRVNVLGMVNQPGMIVFPPEEPMTILDAIGRAGGFNRLANRRSVRLTRVDEEGETKTYVINTNDLVDGGSSTAWELKRDDVIYVPERRF